VALTTWADYKTWRGLAGSDYDTVGGVVLTQAEAVAARAVGVDSLEANDYTETLDGSGTRTVWVRNFRVNSVASVKMLNADGTTASTLTTSEYSFNEWGAFQRVTSAGAQDDWSGVRRRAWPSHSVWPDGFQNIEIAYNAGYAAAPDDLKLAIYKLIDTVLQNRGVDEITQVASGPGTLGIQLADVAQREDSVRLLLAGFRRLP
jgi:hypothetical protein